MTEKEKIVYLIAGIQKEDNDEGEEEEQWSR